jgi:hypothetical protein
MDGIGIREKGDLGTVKGASPSRKPRFGLIASLSRFFVFAVRTCALVK